MNRSYKSFLLFLSIIFCIPVYAAENGYPYLFMPTQIIKINNLYFIVDCNHNQIIYSDSLSTNLKNWKTMTRNTEKPYTITSEGKIHMVIDTGNNRILTFKKLTIRLNLYKRLSFSC